jgi:hypothetical protein
MDKMFVNDRAGLGLLTRIGHSESSLSSRYVLDTNASLRCVWVDETYHTAGGSNSVVAGLRRCFPTELRWAVLLVLYCQNSEAGPS